MTRRALDLIPPSPQAPSSAPAFPGGMTVLMSVYFRDDPSLFARAVDSVFANTVQPDELVLVVDGPASGALADVIARTSVRERVRVLQLPRNVGLARALNHGLASVETEWIARADADDLNLPDRFERQARALADSADRIDLMGGAILEVDRDGQPLAIRSGPLEHASIQQRLRTRNPFNHMTVVYRAGRVRDAGGYPDLHLKEDYGLWATLIARGARCRNIPEVLVHATTGRAMYRRRGGLRVARSEWDLQRHLRREEQTSAAAALAIGCARAASACVPSAARAFLYENFLRERVPRPEPRR